MQIINPSLSLYFISTGLTKKTTSLVRDSISLTKQLYNDLYASSNSCSLQIKADDTTLIEDIIKDDSDIKAILYNGDPLDPQTEPIFTGILSNEHSWRVSMTGEDVFQVKIEDIGTRYLNKPLVDYDDTCLRDTLENVILMIATRCGNISVTFDNTVTSAIKSKILVNKVSSSLTCKDALNTICYEYGLVYYFDASGYLVIRKTPDLTSQPSTTIASEGNFPHYLYTEQNSGVDLTRKSRQYSQAKVQFSTISDSTSIVPIYAVTDKITVPGGEWWDGATHSENIYELTLDEFFVSGKTYYIFNGTSYEEATVTVGDPIPDNTYYEYAGQASTVNMIDSEKGKDILYVYPNTIVPNAEGQTGSLPGYVSVTEEASHPSKWTIKQHENTTNLEVLIDNTQGGTSSIYNLFSAKGRIIRKQGTSNIYRSVVGLTANSEVQFNYEAEWIHDKNDAIALCEELSNYYLYCDNTYTFFCIDDLDLGSIVRVYENLYSGLDVNMFVVAKQFTAYGAHQGLYKYTAQGISAFNLDANTRVENYEIPQGAATLINTSNMYALDDQGIDPSLVTGWQETIPVGIAGDFLWTRTEYVYSNGQTIYEYVVSYLAGEVYDFRLDVRPSNLIQNRRRTDTQTFYFSTIIHGFEGTPTLRYWFSDGDEDDPYEIVAAAAVVQIPFDQSHPSMIVTASLTGAPTQRVEVLALDDTNTNIYYGQFNIDTEDYFDSDGDIIEGNYNLIDWSPLDNLLDSNEQFLQGDSFFNYYQNGDFEDVYVYVYENDRWIPVSFSTLSNSEKSKICSQAQKDVLSTIEAGSVTKSDFGYFNTIIAGTVTADFIGSKEIEVQDGGFIYAGDVDITQPAGQRVGQTGAGFCFDSLGNAEVSNIRITGDSTIEGGSTVLGTLINYDSNGDPVFKTVKDSSTSTSMAGSKVDGTSAPSAYLWSSFVSWLKSYILARATNGTTYTTTTPRTMNGYWNGSSISSKTVTAIKYWDTFPAETQTTVYGDNGPSRADIEKVMYTNDNPYSVKFRLVVVHPKTKSSIWGQTGYGAASFYVKTSGGSIYSTLYNYGEGVWDSQGFIDHCYKYDVVVPPGGYIEATAQPYSGFPVGNWDTDLYCQFNYDESLFMTQGINLVANGGAVYPFDTVFPLYNDYQTYSQRLTCSGLSLNLDMTMAASSSWPVEKYYRFSYTQSPGVSSTITTSVFSSQSFSYRGVSKTVTSITFNNSMLKVVDSDGGTYEFYTSTGYYYPRHTFSFTTLGQSLGAYMRAVLPTDDSNTHDIGASGTYDSGISQRWNTGFFTSLDVSQGIVSKTINSSWYVPIITANYTITDSFDVGTMRPYFINSASTVSLTMPGDSNQRYVILALNVVTSVLIAAGKSPRYIAAAGGSSTSISWTSSSEPYMLVYVLRIQ